MATATINYLGNLRTECTHLASGTKIFTDAPTDNQGKGEAFSPTDLVATSYASCMITIIGIYCLNHELSFENAHATVTKIMSAAPRKIEKLVIDLNLSNNGWDSETQAKIIAVAKACPVARTLGENVEVDLTVEF